MKKNIAVIFGGKSVEHEISIISAIQAIEHMDKSKYNILPIYISKENKFYSSPDFINIDVFKDMGKVEKYAQKELIKENQNVYLENKKKSLLSKGEKIEIDIFFPIVHGTNVEDGKLQGYLSMYDLPIVGPTTLSGAIGQDKSVAKDLLKAYKISQVEYTCVNSTDIDRLDECISDLSYPLILKPASLGSSIGIEIVESQKELRSKVKKALTFDDIVVIENKLENIRELNISIMKIQDEIKVSQIEEVYSNDNILSFEDKYMSGSKGKSQGMASTTRQIPAKIELKTKEEIEKIAREVYKVLRCNGVVRLDLILHNDKIYVNEVNNIPGSLSYYLWEESEIQYEKLLNMLIDQAIKDKYLKQQKTTSFDSNVLNMKSLKLNK